MYGNSWECIYFGNRFLQIGIVLLLTSVRWHHAEAFFKRPQRLFGSDFFVEKLLTLVVASGGVERSRLHRFELTQRELVKLVLQLPGARVVEALHCFGARCPLLVCLAQVRLGTLAVEVEGAAEEAGQRRLEYGHKVLHLFGDTHHQVLVDQVALGLFQSPLASRNPAIGVLAAEIRHLEPSVVWMTFRPALFHALVKSHLVPLFPAHQMGPEVVPKT